MTSDRKQQFQKSLRQIDDFLQAMETSASPALRSKAREMVQALLEMHGAGLSIILEKIRASGEVGRSIQQAIEKDTIVTGLLLLHDLHPTPLDQRVQKALESVRPYLHSHGGNVELLGISEDGVISLKLHGSCHGCPSSQATLRDTIETAIAEAAPDVVSIDVQGEEEPEPSASKAIEGFVPIENLLIAGRSSLPLPIVAAGAPA
jgi:Fe-S cluster biogenesis protein NfuA